ncbi:hypothetical protein B0H11DRAFT_1741442 [Mycena galericulata]|nr:hypothetical protein B0H11DRAFT_1741442 [Mycena galericulata]
MFRTHLHQHPSFPQNDPEERYISAEEIHKRAVREVYQYCFEKDLSQVWAYMWNQWYSPKEWPLWARASCDAIPRLKTTMVVESMWKHIKRRDLAQFNRPRLDLVTYLVIIGLLPRVRQTLDYVRGFLRMGRPKALAGWQVDFKAAWLDMVRTDEHRLVEKQLKWLRTARNTKGREEHLLQLEEEETRDAGTYVTDLAKWVCGCKAYPVNRFLLCKHLVRAANEMLEDRPRTDLRFFLDMRRNHFPPYYSIPGVNAPEADDENEEEVTVLSWATWEQSCGKDHPNAAASGDT